MDTVYYHLYSLYTWVTSDKLHYLRFCYTDIKTEKSGKTATDEANLYKSRFGLTEIKLTLRYLSRYYS